MSARNHAREKEWPSMANNGEIHKSFEDFIAASRLFVSDSTPLTSSHACTTESSSVFKATVAGQGVVLRSSPAQCFCHRNQRIKVSNPKWKVSGVLCAWCDLVCAFSDQIAQFARFLIRLHKQQVFNFAAPYNFVGTWRGYTHYYLLRVCLVMSQ